MRNMQILLLLGILSLPAAGHSDNVIPLPGSFGPEPLLVMVDEVKGWTPENMYEHVNGEAELLKRYGARNLYYASYENDNGAYLTVDIVDMGVPVNAFGLYNLYAGCDGEEYSTSGATVLSGDFTSYAVRGRHFIRIDFDAGEKGGSGRSTVKIFLSELSKSLPSPEPLPRAVNKLKKLARKPCEVAYHPEHVDYDLQSGPGYRWVGPDGETCFVTFFPSPDKARAHAAVLKNRGVSTLLVGGNAVTWAKVSTVKTVDYLKKVLNQVVDQ